MRVFLAVAFLAAIGLGAAAAPSAPPAASSEPGTAVERGRYLVHRVALCIQCHSPRDENGKLLETQLLTGARIPVDSPFPGQPWAYHAPNIRGMLGYTDEEGVRLLTQGITRNGTPPKPPMQQFHMTREDARAVVAYLKSLR